MLVLADAYELPQTSFTYKTGPMTKIAFRGGKAEVTNLEAVVWCLEHPNIILQPREPYDEAVPQWLKLVPHPGPKGKIVLPNGTQLIPPDYAVDLALDVARATALAEEALAEAQRALDAGDAERAAQCSDLAQRTLDLIKDMTDMPEPEPPEGWKPNPELLAIYDAETPPLPAAAYDHTPEAEGTVVYEQFAEEPKRQPFAVRGKNGKTYYYLDGKRVKNPRR